MVLLPSGLAHVAANPQLASSLPPTKKARLPLKQASVLQPGFPSSVGALKLDVCVFNMLTLPRMAS